ncbi:hypothetical protein SAMN05444959_1512 [Paracoccus seriniphilus]|uniref:Uncharacterized protein n=1 Tax=Paracoccus seriniphilus TaxID=184748 RepID=A0A239Q3W1_9RHOB|nr:hypothetical protein SAMN05444959_1512 [Paracoccus seriniphilus]
MGHPEHQSIGLLAALETLILQFFRRCQELGVECLRADRHADGWHIPLHGSQEGRAHVFQRVPEICHLTRLRQGARDGTAITAVAVTSHDLDPGVVTQPGLDRGGFPVRPQADNPMPLQIADQRAVSLPLAPCSVVYADDAGDMRRSW